MKTLTFAFLLVSFLVLQSTVSALTLNDWKTSVSSGAFDDSANYSNYHEPAADIGWRILCTSGAAKNLVQTLSDYSVLGGIRYYVNADCRVTIDGANAVFGQPALESGESVNTTGWGAWGLMARGYNYTQVNLTSGDTAATYSFSNSLQTVSCETTADGPVYTWNLTRGRFSFAGLNGENSALTLNLSCYGDPSTSGYRYENTFDHVETTVPNLAFLAYDTNNLVTVSGGTFDILGNFDFGRGNARTYVGTNVFAVSDGAQVALFGACTVGKKENLKKRFDFLRVTGAGSKFSASSGGAMAFEGSSRLEVGEQAEFESPRSGKVNFHHDARVRFDTGASVKFDTGVIVGGDAGDDAEMVMEGEGTDVVVTDANGVQNFILGNVTGSRGVLTVKGGTFHGSSSTKDCWRLRLASYGANSTGIVNLVSGKIETDNKNQLMVGMSGHGELNVSGGELIVNNTIQTGFNDRTGEQRSIIRQTGGRIYSAGGFALCSVADTASRISDVFLEGGTTEVAAVKATYTKARGHLGTARLTADGGTLRAIQNEDAFIDGLDACSVGDGGLVIDTGAFGVTVPQSIRNMDGESGLLRKAGSGTLTLSCANYAVSSTSVEQGSLVFASAEGSFETALAVGPSCTFSLQGVATGVTLTGLAVNGGTLALDLGDVITVEGPVSLSALRLSFSALPEVDSDGMDFLVVDGELDDASKRALRRAIVDNVATEGAHVDVTVDYDSGIGKTTIKVLHRTDAPVITDLVTWTGSGSWSTAENWDPAKPTGEKKAVFGDEGSATEVDVDEAAVAGAISFARDGYTLSGEGSIEIAGAQGAAQIEVTAGRQTVDVPLTLDAVTEVAVADGASLTLAKPLTDGGIVKTGSGTAILAATNDFFKPVSLSGGILELTGAATLGGAPQLNLEGNDTLVVSGEEPQHITAPVAANSTIGAPTILKTDCDVTFDSIVVSGALIKRGAGTATLDATQSSVASVLSSVKSAAGDAAPATHAVTYFPADGSVPPVAGWCGFTVAEGEFVIRGSAESPAVKIQNFLVGMNATNMDAGAQAKLTIDGVKVDASTAHCYVGYGTSLQYSRQYTPTLALLNGAFLNANAFHIGTTTYGGSDHHPTFLMTNSTIYAAYGLDLTGVESANANCAITAAKGSDILASTSYPIRLQGRFDIDLDGCYLGGGNSAGARTADLATLQVYNYSTGNPGGTIRFRNGSILNAILLNFRYPVNPITFLWDDSEWRWANGLGTYTFTADSVNPDKTSFKMQGKGIILKPAEGATFTTEVPFVGAGGVQNLGAGTVKFAAGTAQFTGAAYAAEGATIDFTEAGVVNAALSGPGTFRLASANGLKLALTATDDWTVTEVPTLDATALTGILTVDFGRDADHPLLDTNPKGLVIAKLAPGTTYVPTALAKVRNTGLKSKRGVLTVNANGEIVMDVIDTGLMMIVR